MDFAKLVEIFEAHSVHLCECHSVLFDTTSMGASR